MVTLVWSDGNLVPFCVLC